MINRELGSLSRDAYFWPQKHLCRMFCLPQTFSHWRLNKNNGINLSKFPSLIRLFLSVCFLQLLLQIGHYLKTMLPSTLIYAYNCGGTEKLTQFVADHSTVANFTYISSSLFIRKRILHLCCSLRTRNFFCYVLKNSH